MKVALLIGGLVLLSGAFGQDAALKPRVGKEVRSPEVHADGSMTFRLKAPNASKVYLYSEAIPSAAFTKDEKGVWSLTTKPLEPDLYCYMFAVDGSGIEDPGNPDSKPIATGGHESIVRIPGAKPLLWEPQDVPHGTVQRTAFFSKAVGETRNLTVYTPPGYERSKASYPVLYLLHGVMEDDQAWTTAGQAQTILDNLIAQGKTKPMIVVMPTGYGFPNIPDGMGQQLYTGPAVQKKLLDVVSTSLREEIMPLVASRFRVKKGPSAIAGVSMGGAQALYIGLNYPKLFGSVNSFSGAILMFGQPFDDWFPALSARGQSVEISCGTEDFLINPNRKFEEWLKGKNVPFHSTETKGGHTWNVWRRNLIELLTRSG